ncbi:MAG: CHAT domain-containing protein [Arachnia sp.]
MELIPDPADADDSPRRPSGAAAKPAKKVGNAKSKPRRWLANVEQQDREAPLEVGADYVVSFDAGTSDQPHLATALFQERSLSGADLTVQLSSKDFDIRSDPIQPLKVPIRGATAGPARFLVGARRPGVCTLTATVHRGGNFVTLLHFTVWAARKGTASLTVVGRSPAGLANLEPRDISLTLERDDRGAGYNCHVVADGRAAPPVCLAITPEGLAQEVDALQKSLMEVVRTLDKDGREVFQAAVQISKEHERAALRTMAHAGARLFREIFFGDSSNLGSQDLGSYLRSAANDKDSILTLQVVDNEAPIPWALLYVGEVRDGARLDWDNFLGLRHLIEQLPLAKLGPKRTKSVQSTPHLTVGLNVNLNVDQGLTTEVAEHQARWTEMVKQRTRLEIITRNSSADVLKALANKKNADQILYFYCHATSKGIDGDTGKATITMEPNGRLTLDYLKDNTRSGITLAGHPLVFINACESADLTPLFYTGFVPYFMGKGARGVIGTQCKTPALLAIKCGELFFDRFLDGCPVGQSMLETRRELLDKYRNPLGLLYAVHCDVDTLIVPPLLVEPL